MMRSLFAGVSGLKNHQTRMDVLGNNIANVNTIGFKASRVNFQDVLSQTLQGASAAQGSRGGTNPLQVGLGMGLSSIDTIFTDGSFQPTGKQTDLSIQGQGFFILSNGGNDQVYTRAGNFDFDQQGNFLVPGTGYKVMGWSADAAGNIDPNQPINTIQIPVGATMQAKASANIDYANNLSANAAIGSAVQASINVFDSLGNAHKIQQTFYKVDDCKWLARATCDDGTLTNAWNVITFDSTGKCTDVATVTTPPTQTTAISIDNMQLKNSAVGDKTEAQYVVYDANLVPKSYKITFTAKTAGGTDFDYSIEDLGDPNGSPATGTTTWDGSTYTNFPVTLPGSTVAINLGTGANAPTAPGASGNVASNADPYPNTPGSQAALGLAPMGGAAPLSIMLNIKGKITQFGGESTVQALNQDGYDAGTLNNQTIDPSGIIVGRFTNGQTKVLAQVALATFNNPGGLNKAGESYFSKSSNSGEPQVGPAGTGGRGKFNPGTLEMSNVDLAQEFSNMIITQRGFQANSKIISTTDEMLQELANLKR